MSQCLHRLITPKPLCYISIMPPKSRAVSTHPYEIEYRGKIIRCGSFAQMKAALAELEGGKIIREETPWTEEEFQKFTGRIHVPQRRLLATLLEAGPREWVEDSGLREVLGAADNIALSGSLSGLSKVARMFNIDPRRVYAQNAVYKHGQAKRTYQITAGFAQAAARHKWPAKDDLRDRL
jgi:hypothetical protein